MIKFLPPPTMVHRFWEVLSCSAVWFSIKVSGKLSKHTTTAKHLSGWNLLCLKSLYHTSESSNTVGLLCFVVLFCGFFCLFCFFKKDFISYLKFSMAVNILCSLSAQDKFCFIRHSYQMVLHGLTQQPEDKEYSRTALREWSPNIKICKYSTYTNILSSVP